MVYPSKTKQSVTEYMRKYRKGKKTKKGKPKTESNNEASFKKIDAIYENLKQENPTKQVLVYTAMLAESWSRTKSTEIIGMWILSRNVSLDPKIISPHNKRQNERELMQKILGGLPDSDAVDSLMSLPEQDREWLKDWYENMNSPIWVERRKQEEERERIKQVFI